MFARPLPHRPVLAALAAAAVLLLAACGSSSTVAGDEAAATTSTSPSSTTGDDGVPDESANPEPGTGDSLDTGPLVRCDDVPRLSSSVEGSLGLFDNPDDEVMGVLLSYGLEHPDTYAGVWIDRDHGGALVLAFTDDPAPHREAILARGPSPDDVETVTPRPPIADPRPLGGRDDLAIDVVRADFSETELMAASDHFWSERPLYVSSGGIDTVKNRLTIDLIDPTPEQLADLAERAPLDMLCVTVTLSPTPPTGPLDVLPLGEGDALLACGPGGPDFPISAIERPAAIEDVDHPAAVALRAVMADPPLGLSYEDVEQPPPADGWFVLAIDDTTALFGNGADLPIATAHMEQVGDDWVLRGWSIACEPTIELPIGLGIVSVELDPDHPAPGPTDTVINVLVAERACASAQPMGDRLRGPQVRETDEEIVIAFAVESLVGNATCPSNPSVAVAIELADPVGSRPIRNGLLYPAAELTFSEGG